MMFSNIELKKNEDAMFMCSQRFTLIFIAHLCVANLFLLFTDTVAIFLEQFNRNDDNLITEYYKWSPF